MTWTGRALPGNRWDLLDGVVPVTPARVSVIVAHYRQPDQLARTLHALRHQDHPGDRVEIIVADDGSPETPVVPDGVRLVRQDDDGFRLAAVRNLGAAAATGEVLVFLDADTTPEPSFVRELARLPALAPDCVTVGRRRHADLSGMTPTSDIRAEALRRELSEPTWLAQAYAASRNLLDADDRSYRHAIGAVLACSRPMFDDVGGFEEEFTAYGGEDWEWVYRAWLRGAMLAHVPDAVAWHDGPDRAERAASPDAKNAETIHLSQWIPLPGSGSRGLPREKVDIAVVGPIAGATLGQSFVSVDSLLAAIPGAEWFAGSGDDLDRGSGRYDRVRVLVEILHPLRVVGGSFADEIRRAGAAELGELIIADAGGVDCVRVTALRTRRRHRRWGRDDLFGRARSSNADVCALVDDIDVEGYLGGWG